MNDTSLTITLPAWAWAALHGLAMEDPVRRRVAFAATQLLQAALEEAQKPQKPAEPEPQYDPDNPSMVL